MKLHWFSPFARMVTACGLLLLAGSLVHAADFALIKNNADWATAANWSAGGPPTATDDAWVYTGPDGARTFGGTSLSGFNYVRGNSAGSTFPGKTLHCVAPGVTAPVDAGVYIAYAKTYTIADLQLTNCSIKQNNATVPGGVLKGKITLSGCALIGSNGTSRSLTIDAVITGDVSTGQGLQVGQKSIDPTVTFVTFTAANDLTGTITQIGATFKIANDNALGNITNLTVDGMAGFPAIFAPQPGITLTMPNLALVVGPNGRVDLNGSDFTVKSLFVNGVEKTPGTYSAAALIGAFPANFTGAGNIIVGGTVNPVKHWTMYN